MISSLLKVIDIAQINPSLLFSLTPSKQLPLIPFLDIPMTPSVLKVTAAEILEVCAGSHPAWLNLLQAAMLARRCRSPRTVMLLLRMLLDVVLDLMSGLLGRYMNTEFYIAPILNFI